MPQRVMAVPALSLPVQELKFRRRRGVLGASMLLVLPRVLLPLSLLLVGLVRVTMLALAAVLDRVAVPIGEQEGLVLLVAGWGAMFTLKPPLIPSLALLLRPPGPGGQTRTGTALV